MTEKLRKAAEQALETLKFIDDDYWHDLVAEPIADLQAALDDQDTESFVKKLEDDFKRSIRDIEYKVYEELAAQKANK